MFQQLVLWDVESDSVKLFSPASILNHHKNRNTSKTGQQEIDEEDSSDSIYTTLPEQLSHSTLNDQLGLLKELLGRCPVSHYWDSTESRMLAIQYEVLHGESGRRASKLDTWLASMGRTGKHAQVGVKVLQCQECIAKHFGKEGERA